MTKQQILQTAIDTYGSDAQMLMAIEEMSELTKAICKYFRSNDSRATESIIEEMADVKIMLAQLEIMFGSPTAVEKEKLERLAGRLGLEDTHADE